MTENELNQEVNNFIRMLGNVEGGKIKKEWAKSGVLLRIQNQMKREKTLEAIMQKVEIKEEIVDRKEIIDDN